MPRKKRLVDLVRGETFSPYKDQHLLGTDEKQPWPGLERYRRAYLACATDADRLDLAKELSKARARDVLGDLQAELLKLGPRDSFQQLERFFPRFLRHYAGPAAGKTFRLARFQREFLQEFWRRDRHGRRVYQVGLLMIPKGNGKTPLAAGLGLHALVSETDAPEVYNIAGAKDQAAICFDFARRNVEDGRLAAWVDVGGRKLHCPEHRGEYEILSSDGYLSAGVIPSTAIYDELFIAKHGHQREAWNSQEQALEKREGRAYMLGISTPGHDKDTLLGERYDAAVAHPKLEVHRDGAVMILRDEESGFLFTCYGAPDDADIEDPKVLRACNPAPWVNVSRLLRALYRPGADEQVFRRLRAGQWTKTKHAWIAAGVWDRLRGDTQIPAGAEITVAVDAARTHDTTSVAWQWISPAGRKVTRAHVWSVRQNVSHHTFVPGGELVNEELVEPFIHQELVVNRGYRLRAIGYDPRYFHTEARHLSNAGFTVIPVEPHSKAMGEAVVQFEKDVLGRIEHDGDVVLRNHIDAIDAIRNPDGSKKIGKRTDGVPIDAGIAGVIVNYLHEIELPAPAAFSWRPL